MMPVFDSYLNNSIQSPESHMSMSMGDSLFDASAFSGSTAMGASFYNDEDFIDASFTDDDFPPISNFVSTPGSFAIGQQNFLQKHSVNRRVGNGFVGTTPLTRQRQNPPRFPGVVSRNSRSGLNTGVFLLRSPTRRQRGSSFSDSSPTKQLLSSPQTGDESQDQQQQQGEDFAGRYKTELCRTFSENGTCKYGEKCQFAHGRHELKQSNTSRHPKYKTEFCRTFHTVGFCPYGPRCHFMHMPPPTHDLLYNMAFPPPFRDPFTDYVYSPTPSEPPTPARQHRSPSSFCMESPAASSAVLSLSMSAMSSSQQQQQNSESGNDSSTCSPSSNSSTTSCSTDSGVVLPVFDSPVAAIPDLLTGFRGNTAVSPTSYDYDHAVNRFSPFNPAVKSSPIAQTSNLFDSCGYSASSSSCENHRLAIFACLAN